MSIVSSVISINNLQSDGRRVIREIWTDNAGNVFTYDYIADVGIDPNVVLQNRTASVTSASDAMQIAQATYAAANSQGGS